MSVEQTENIMSNLFLFFNVVNFCLGVINLMLAYDSYKIGDNSRALINGAIGIFCIWSAAL